MPAPNLADLVDSYDAQAASLQAVQAQRVRDILLVASLYDAFTLSEGKRLTELIYGTFYDLWLSSAPTVTRVSTRREALVLLAERRFDLVITMSQVGDMTASEFGLAVRAARADVPVFLLAYSAEELRVHEGGPVAIAGIDRSFIWRGDVRLFLAMIKLVEDELTADHDAHLAGVRVIVLVEDNVAFYSSYLPMLLTELVRQTTSLISEEVNLGQRMLRRRLRPKILLATSLEEAWALYTGFRDHLLCVISDVEYPRQGREDPEAGIALFAQVRREDRQLPLLLQSSKSEVAGVARELGAGFVRKHSPTLLADLRAFMLERLGFGDFVFRLPDGTEVARASDVSTMRRALETVPPEALQFHGRRHDFSNWLMARTEFGPATALRRLQVSDFASVEEMRVLLLDTLLSIQTEKRRGQVEDFDAARFSDATAFVRIGGGSLGGKGRGLAFMHDLLSRARPATDARDARIVVPRSCVVGTDVFDRFLEAGELLAPAMAAGDDRDVLRLFLASPLPDDIVAELAAYLDGVRVPLAVRSSSLLEDSHLLPAAGVYPTHMLPNVADDPALRLADLAGAIRHIYAATFFRRARAYLASTSSLVEDEKMAVVIQPVVGRRHGQLFYPDLGGTAASYNYYPVREMRPEEGVASVVLGLGKAVVEGERAVRFCPAHPEWLPQFSTPDDCLDNAQREFLALDLSRTLDYCEPDPDTNIVRQALSVAERDGTLWPVASTYSADSHAVHDGTSRPGVRLVTMAPVLKHDVFPLARTVRTVLDLGTFGLAMPVEIEFAVDLRPSGGGAPEFALLQVRPLGTRARGTPVALDAIDPGDVFVHSCAALGAGRDATIRDIVAVRMDTFDRGRTVEVADAVGQANARLAAEGRPYLLIGPGRWGTADRWLGIPVRWAQIAGVRAIVECGLGDFDVEPSQGTHFFHNLTSFGIPYFTVGRHVAGSVDWGWLAGLEPRAVLDYVNLYRLDEPLEILVDGRTGEGVVLKPRAPT